MASNSWISKIAIGTLTVAALVGGCGGEGADGKNGADGTNGTPGSTGPTGPGGEAGPPGTPGANGEAGPPGDPGEAGLPGQNVFNAGPGLDLTVDKVDILASGEATVTFTVKDAAGTPLDVNGKYTLGAVNARFVVSWLGTDTAGDPTQYTAYTTTQQTSPITNKTETLPAADSGGTYTDLGNGQWEYKLKTAITVADPAKTHSVGVYATRAFEGKTYVDNDVFSWVPGGGTPLDRELVITDSCNKCHGSLRIHGGSRRNTKLCTVCHVAGATDPDTGNTIDFRVMIHKIHRGHDLPSVVAGGKYEIIGFNQSVHDYSTVAFPTWHEVNSCESCHGGAKQADRWQTHPSRAACGACHDLTSFDATPPTGFTAHAGGPQANDTLCMQCHKDGGLSPITTKHLTADKAPGADKVDASILGLINTAPGQTPEVTFNVKVNGTDRDVIANPVSTLRVTIAGPTTDYATYWQQTIPQPWPATPDPATQGVLVKDGANFKYKFPTNVPIPAGATGTYAAGMEVRTQPGGSGAPQYAAFNPVVYFPVTDNPAKPRRDVIDGNNCLNCHRVMAAHGGSRTNPQYCNFCHNPNNANDERVARVESTTIVAQPVHLKAMVHSIHMGEELSQPYVLGGFPAPSKTNALGSPLNFGEVRYPRPRNDCAACHKAGTWNLPIVAGALPTLTQTLICTEDPSADGDNYCDTRNSVSSYAQPVTAACTSCHDAPSAKTHAQLNTTVSGQEACATCHGAGKAFDINEAHALTP